MWHLCRPGYAWDTYPGRTGKTGYVGIRHGWADLDTAMRENPHGARDLATPAQPHCPGGPDATCDWRTAVGGRRRPSQSQIPVPYCCSSMPVCPCLEDGARSIPGRLTVESAGGRAASGQRRPLPASGDPAPWPLQLQACSLAPLLQQNSIGK